MLPGTSLTNVPTHYVSGLMLPVAQQAKLEHKATRILAKVEKRAAKAAAKPGWTGGKSQLIALLLAIFLGLLSIHRFYLGYTGLGIAQILLIWLCGVGLIWVIIDIIRIATGDLEPNHSVYEDTL